MSSGRPDSRDDSHDAAQHAEAPRLLADIGGTNARFALLEGNPAHADPTDEMVLACAQYPTLVAAIEHYLSSVRADGPGRRPLQAAIAIAGPITGDLIHLTNHVWEFSAARTRQQLGLQHLSFFNDFTALALAIRHLPPRELLPVGRGRPVADKPIALIGPGTGLGVSGLIPTGGQWVPLQGEGGHVTLPAMNEREIAVLKQLHQRFSHVSAERVLSGPGLVNLYDALCEVEGIAHEALTPEEITQRALAGTCRICMETVSMFCAMLGTMAGNLVLTLGAVGGVYIGGGIVPRLGQTFVNSHFRDRFEDKGRFTAYLAAVPVYVIQTSLPAFVGLARSFIDPGPRWDAE